MFETFIIQPIFNLLVLIFALIPGHDFGIAIILFTVLVRLLMWPMLRKQLHQSRLMRMLQPKVKEIKAKSKGDRQLEGQQLMELYKKYGVSPFTTLGLLFVQFPIFIGLFAALNRLIKNPQTIIDFSYSWVKDLPHMQTIVADLRNFDESFLGLMDATQYAYQGGKIFWPAMLVAISAGVFQFFQSRQLTPKTNTAKSISQIMRESAQGKDIDQGEINAAVGRNVSFLFAPLITVAAATLPAGAALYLAAGGLVGLIQQRFILNKDVEELEDLPNTDPPATKQGKVTKVTIPNKKKPAKKAATKRKR